MENHLELGDTAMAGSGSGVGVGGPLVKPWIPGRHRCHSCDRTRNVKVRVLSWMLGKLMLMLIIVITSASTTFLYHKLLPDDVTPPSSSSSSSARSSSSSGASSEGHQQEPGSRGHDLHMANAAVRKHPLADEQHTAGSYKGSHRYSPTHITARLGIRHSSQGANLTMVSEGRHFFTSGHVLLVDGGLLVQRATTLFLSADIILVSKATGKKNITTVFTCLTRGHLGSSRKDPISCQLTYLSMRNQRMARVSILYQAKANESLYVECSWPSYVLSDNNDSQQSVFTAFEVGRS